MPRIYTKKGDAGKTRSMSGKFLWKDNIMFDVCGSIDELNSCIGLVNGLIINNKIKGETRYNKFLENIQNDLFRLGCQIASYEDKKNRNKLPHIQKDHIKTIENMIDSLEQALPPLKQFILPSGPPLIASIHLARSICRRTERCLVRFTRKHPSADTIAVQYLNRLSDALFILARSIAHVLNQKEIYWTTK